MSDYYFHCKDCSAFNICHYYGHRKGTSLICKNFIPSSDLVTIYGYSIEPLKLTAELLRKYNIEPEDLKDLCNDFSKAYEIVKEEYEQMLKESLENVFRKGVG